MMGRMFRNDLLVLILVVSTVIGVLFGQVHTPAEVQSLTVKHSGLVVRMNGVGERQVNDAKAVVTEQLSLSQDQAVTPPLADDMAFFLLQRYLELGFKEAKVEWEIVGDEMVLNVQEGRLFVLGEVRYLGEVSEPEEELTSYLLRPTHEKLGTNQDHPPFVEADIESGSGLVQRYLHAQGFLDAEVGLPLFETDQEAGLVHVSLQVSQGKRYLFDRVTVIGGLEKYAEQERAAVEGVEGQAFSEVKVEEMRTSLLDIYQQQGHFGVVVSATADPINTRTDRVAVELTVLTGPVFRVAGVAISPEFSRGATRLIKSSYRRSLGKVYSPADLELLHRRLLDTEMFARLEVTPSELDNDELTLELSGEEAKRITLSAYVGYETFLGPVAGVEARHVNIFDWGDTARFKLEGTGRGFNGGLLWLDPAIFNSAQTLEAELSAETFEIFDYNRRKLSMRTALGRQWSRNLSAKLFADYSVNAVDSDIASDLPLLGDLDYLLFNLGNTWLIDFRDSPVLPVKGWMSSFTVTAGLDTLGGEVSYLRSDVLFSIYQPLGKKFRVAAHARTSALKSDESIDELPIDVRLFNGGANSVRSFPEREMGLKSDGGTPLGGSLSQVFSLELSYAMSPNFELALFGDAGSLDREEDEVFSMSGDFKYAVGAGLRYKLPIGPLRVDYGYNPDRGEGDPVGALHITFGFAF